MAYDQAYYESIREGCQKSAAAIVPRLVDYHRPKTMIDMGCGEGWWVKEFRDRGVEAYGVDQCGPTRVTHGRYWNHDLESPFVLDRKFDLCLCLEVAEHLSPQRALPFISELRSLAPVVVFSAAIPGQGGEDHRNERWQSWWVSQFEAQGFKADDSIRWEFWSHPEVCNWYAQNILTFIAWNGPASQLPSNYSLRPFCGDVVHPGFYKQLLIDWRKLFEPKK